MEARLLGGETGAYVCGVVLERCRRGNLGTLAATPCAMQRGSLAYNPPVVPPSWRDHLARLLLARYTTTSSRLNHHYTLNHERPNFFTWTWFRYHVVVIEHDQAAALPLVLRGVSLSGSITILGIV